ncbi:hypothetical protein LKL35_33350 [Streptomyces sp. ET3-23]|uniref:hypothetical protein n=1 Tax=Streptomyces sp. ET3-23 TaxID=2885643 RepID=UPI001D109464|nr:hypothetical protein [Streptomyces sp. ET3-23]MCC2280269.1 hypothetical protein [Streptomyces sp. ET3-23]
MTSPTRPGSPGAYTIGVRLGSPTTASGLVVLAHRKRPGDAAVLVLAHAEEADAGTPYSSLTTHIARIASGLNGTVRCVVDVTEAPEDAAADLARAVRAEDAVVRKVALPEYGGAAHRAPSTKTVARRDLIGAAVTALQNHALTLGTKPVGQVLAAELRSYTDGAPSVLVLALAAAVHDVRRARKAGIVSMADVRLLRDHAGHIVGAHNTRTGGVFGQSDATGNVVRHPVVSGTVKGAAMVNGRSVDSSELAAVLPAHYGMVPTATPGTTAGISIATYADTSLWTHGASWAESPTGQALAEYEARAHARQQALGGGR